MRAKGIGHVVVNMTVDRAWSQYFCCILTGHREFVRKNPVATKRAMRAILKGANLCVSSPEPTARLLASRGFASGYDMALQLVREVPYARWRDYDTEDSVRFYALRPTGDWVHQVEPEEDHRAAYRLAFSQRPEAGTEGLAPDGFTRFKHLSLRG
jgi:NitT/TauT family transport system substrate-binding protein